MFRAPLARTTSLLALALVLALACSDERTAARTGTDTDTDTETGTGTGTGTESGTQTSMDTDGSEGSTGECGNAVVEDDEVCDDGNQDNTDSCLSDCTEASCGDGHVGPGETCDDGNDIDDDACKNNCSPASCGDGEAQVGEACDDGNADNTDDCLDTCVAAACGDGEIWAGQEACDDGNADNTDACLGTCMAASCGDGEVWAGQEACDDGNADNTDSCTVSCSPPACDDGIQSGTEAGPDCGGDCPNECLIPDNWYFPVVDDDDYTLIPALFADGAGAVLSLEISPNGQFAGQQWPAGTYVVRLDATGTMVWHKQAPAPHTALHEVESGGFVGVGHYNDDVILGQGELNQTMLAHTGGNDAFAAKYTDDGQLEWATSISETGNEWLLDVVPLTDGTYILIGFFTWDITLNPNTQDEIYLGPFNNNQHLFVTRYEPGVGHLWAQAWVEGNYDDAVRLPDDSVVLCGWHTADLVYEPGTLNESTHQPWGGGDAFLTRISSNGQRAWEGQLGGGFRTYVRDLDIAPDNSAIYLVGEWDGMSSFDPLVEGQLSKSSLGSYDAYLARVSLDGALEWIEVAGSPANELGRGVAALANGNVVFGGSFAETVHIGEDDPDAVDFVEPGFNWTTDAFFATYSSTSDFLFADQITSPWSERVWDFEPAGEAVLMTVGYLDANLNPQEDTVTFMSGKPGEAMVLGDWADQVLAKIVPGP